MSDFNLTLFEACEVLSRSKKSISRYIRQGFIHPKRVKSQRGTLEYRFSKADLEAFRLQGTQDKTRQETGDTPNQTNQRGQAEPTEAKPAKTKEIKQGQRSDLLQDVTSLKDRTEKTGQDGEIINLLKETTGLLKGQLNKKDEQIKDLGGKIDQLIERDRETNILIGQLQSKVLMLEQPKETTINKVIDRTGQDTADRTGQDKTFVQDLAQNKPIKPLKKTKTKGKKPKQTANKKEKTQKPKKKGFWSKLFN